MWPVERLKKRLVMLFSTRVCLQQAVNCALWLVCVVRESWSERGLSLIEVTWCYNSHMLPVGRKTTLTLPPWLSPHLTSWPKKSSTDKKKKSKLHKHWEFRVYQGFDITWRGSWVSLFLFLFCRETVSLWITLILWNMQHSVEWVSTQQLADFFRRNKKKKRNR